MTRPRAARGNFARIRRAILLVLVVVILIPVLGFVLIVFSGERVHRSALEQLLENVLNRPVEIAGEVELSLSLSPKLSISNLIVEDVTDPQPKQEDRAPFLHLGKGEFQIDLRHLLVGGIVIPLLALSDLEANLRRDKEGKLNWLATKDEEVWEVDREDETLVIPLIAELSFERVRVLYVDELEGRQADLVLKSLRKVNKPDTEESLLIGEGEINDEPFEIRGRLASLHALLGSRENFPIELDAAFPSMDIQLSGMANPWGEDAEGDLKLEVSIYTLAGLTENLAIPLESDGVLQASGRLTGSLEKPTLSEIDVALSLEDGGGLDLEGAIEDLVNLQGLDLTLSAGAPENFVARDLIPLNLPRLATTKLEGTVRGDLPLIELSDLSLDIRGETGEFLSLSGEMTADISTARPKFPHGNFSLSLKLEDSKSLSDLITIELPETGAATLEADFELRAQALKVANLEMRAERLGGISLMGNGEIDDVAFYGENFLTKLIPDLNFEIEVDKGAEFFEALGWASPRLGAFSASLGLTRPKDNYRLNVFSAKLDGKGDLAAELTGEIGELIFTPQISAEELDFKISAYSPKTVPFSNWAGLGLPELGATRFKAKMTGSGRAPQFTEVEISVGEGGPIPLIARGKAEGFDYLADPPRLKGVDLALSVSGSDPRPIFEHYGIEMPHLGVFAGTARLFEKDELLSLSDLDLHAETRSGQSLKITGRVNDVISTTGIRLSADYTGALAEVIGIEPASALGEIRARAVLSDKDGSIGLEDINVESNKDDLYKVVLSGALDDLTEYDEITLALNASVDDAQHLASIFEVDLPAFAHFGFDGEVSGSVEKLRGEGDFTLGSSELHGVVAGAWAGLQPHFSATLTSPLLKFKDFGLLPQDREEKDTPLETKPEERIFKSNLLPFEFLKSFDLDIEIVIDELTAGVVAVDRVTAKASLKEGLLNLDPMKFHFAGGTVANTLHIDGAKEPVKVVLTSRVGDLDLESIFGKLGTQVPLDGELDWHIDLTAVGQSPRELAESMSGTFELAMSRGRILLGFFNLTTVDVFSWLFSSEAQQGYSEITCFIMRFEVENGFAQSEAIVLDTPSVRSGGQGKIDFHSEKLDILFDPEPKRRRLVQFTTPFAIRGPINSPSVEVNPASATANALGGIIFSPLNALGSFFTSVSDNGADSDNPCLTE